MSSLGHFGKRRGESDDARPLFKILHEKQVQWSDDIKLEVENVRVE